ncbi:PrsW family glutamic-type intramembrane protease [Aeoliella sp. SH292]|uniref:PrsW family glutamic-type intramembrane protease n=1 Tax=Aeoliella sp. SH292 TaxID=3454464 RepID=UPI003F9A9C80
MQLQPYLRRHTRQPEFLWKVVVAILAIGVMVALAVQAPEPEVEITPNQEQQHEQFGEHFSQQQLLASEERWAELWWSIPTAMWLSVSPGATVLAAITGICWFTFLLQAGQPYRPTGIRWYLAAIGVVLGIASVWPTLFLIWWQEAGMGLEESTELIPGLRFFILGVGLREELSKLLLFLPLVPWIIWRRSEREALLVAACVGLGFAMEENVSYFYGSAFAAPGRYLTANFFHLSVTGLVGLALCRGIWNPRERAGEAVATFLLAVVLHGLYDAFIVLPALQQYALFNSVLYILLAYRFFHEMRTWWQSPGETVSLTGTFLFSMAVIVSVTLVYLSAEMGIEMAVAGSFGQAIGLGVTIYMFLREVPESIIDV